MLWKWVYYTQRCIWEQSCSHRSLLGGRDILVGVWRMSRTQPGGVREEDPVVLWHRKESTHWRDREKAGVSEVQGLWGERGDDAGPWRPRRRTSIYPKRMEETITVLKAGEWGDERYSLEERCQFHGGWARQGQDCRRRYLGGSSPTSPVRYGAGWGEAASRMPSRCAAGWWAPHSLRLGRQRWLDWGGISQTRVRIPGDSSRTAHQPYDRAWVRHPMFSFLKNTNSSYFKKGLE